MNTKYDLILWDFNGTLLDDVEVALRSVNDILKKRARAPINLETYRSYIDTPIINFYKHLFDLNIDTFEQLAKEFHEGYERYEHLAQPTQGVPELIDRLSALGIRHVVCSASEKNKVTQQLTGMGIAGRFDHIIAASDRTAGSKIENAVNYMKQCDADPSRTLFIGDCVHDYSTAVAIGAQCALLTSGHQLKSDLLTCKAIVVDTINELIPHIFCNGGEN